jgi:hypothetical protein
MVNKTNVTNGTRVEVVVNFSTRIGSVIKIQKNGLVVVLADAVYQEKTGRRLYAAQRFTVDPKHVRLV